MATTREGPVQTEDGDVGGGPHPAFEINMPGTPEDGGQHALVVRPGPFPWVATPKELTDLDVPMTVLHRIYVIYAPKLCYLEPFLRYPETFRVEMLMGLSAIMDCYRKVPKSRGYVIKIGFVPPEHRDLWPRFNLELNFHEHSLLEPWQRDLYTWVEAENKFKLDDPAWGPSD